MVHTKEWKTCITVMKNALLGQKMAKIMKTLQQKLNDKMILVFI